GKRQDKANEMLEEYLSYPEELLIIKCKVFDSNLKDICTNSIVSFSKHRVANLEYKSDDCCFNTSPYLENCSYYLVFCNKQANSSSNSPSSYVTNLLCFLVTIAEPYFSVFSTILADIAIIDSLILVFPLIWQKHDKMILSISRIFRALKKSLKILYQDYNQVGNLVQTHSKDPSFLSFPNIIINNECYNIEIDCKIDDYLLWVVTFYNEQRLPKPKRACVKIVQKDKHLLNTHQLLVEARYASKVLTSLIIPENWLMVYMKYLEDYLTLNYFASINEQNHLRKKIKEIVRYLHDAGHIHGDLHEGNILVCQLTNNNFDVKLIDFEWSRE
ncbi:10635_t:CDS:2, partial [Scutellospora calospora]